MTIVALLMSAPEVIAARKAKASFKAVQTGVIRGGDKAGKLSVDITGADDVYLVVTYGGDSHSHDQAAWAEPRLTKADGSVVDMTTLKPVSSKCGWGKLFVNTNHQGGAINISGRTFERGFFAHGPSILHFKLAGAYTRFEAKVGIDGAAGKNGSSEFIVTSVAPQFPKQSAYSKATSKAPKTPAIKVVPFDEIPFEFNAAVARQLVDKGVEELIFIRRFTLTANHVYTEYVNSRWTPGGGLCALNLKTGAVREILPQLSSGVVNRFDISYDATKILFDFKASQSEGYRIYEVGIDGTGLRQVTFPPEEEKALQERYGSAGYHHGTDDLHPCYLPDGGIVFVSTRCHYSILCHGGDIYTTKVIYRMDADGKNMRALSNSAVSEASPAVLPDGRILYHRWEYIDKAAGNVKALWAMRPDGTASAEIFGNTLTNPETLIYARPVPGAEDKICVLGTTHCCPNNAMGTVIVLDIDKYLRSRDVMDYITEDIDARTHNGFSFLVDGKWITEKTGQPGRLFKDPYPMSETLFIATYKPKGHQWNDPYAYRLCLLDGAGQERDLLRDPTMSCWHPYPVMTREKPPVPTTPIDEDLAARNLAACVVTDIYQGMDGVERGAVKHLRIMEQVSRPWTAHNTWKGDKLGMAHTATGVGLLGLKAQYGVVPVEEDGSAYFYAPAEKNIYFQALDENYAAIQTERTYVNYMPGETRSCIGCHETPDQMPTMKLPGNPLALRRAPSMPGPQPGETKGRKVLDYANYVQPVWDKHCVACHNAKDLKGGLNLGGELTNIFCVSYDALRGTKQKSEPIHLKYVGRQGLEDVGAGPVEYLPPYAMGAYTSVLAAMLSDGAITLADPVADARARELAKKHKKVKLSKADYAQIVNWIDAGCQYYGSYWGQKNAQYVDSPYFRPTVSFDEATGREWPEALLGLYNPE